MTQLGKIAQCADGFVIFHGQVTIGGRKQEEFEGLDLRQHLIVSRVLATPNHQLFQRFAAQDRQVGDAVALQVALFQRELGERGEVQHRCEREVDVLDRHPDERREVGHARPVQIKGLQRHLSDRIQIADWTAFAFERFQSQRAERGEVGHTAVGHIQLLQRLHFSERREIRHARFADVQLD